MFEDLTLLLTKLRIFGKYINSGSNGNLSPTTLKNDVFIGYCPSGKNIVLKESSSVLHSLQTVLSGINRSSNSSLLAAVLKLYLPITEIEFSTIFFMNQIREK